MKLKKSTPVWTQIADELYGPIPLNLYDAAKRADTLKKRSYVLGFCYAKRRALGNVALPDILLAMTELQKLFPPLNEEIESLQRKES